MITKTATIIYRDTVDNISWGWFAGTGRKMHVQRLDSDREVARVVILERDGRRVFEPEVGHRKVVLDRLREFIDLHRPNIERRWVESLVLEGRLTLDVEPGFVLLTIYSGEPMERTRGIGTPGRDYAVAHLNGPALRVETGPGERPMLINLADVFYGERAEREAWKSPAARSSI